MNPRYLSVAQRAAHRCEYCRAPEVIFNFPFEVEHIIPQSQRRANDETNLALSCRACNVHKADCLTSFDSMTQTEVALFNPRQDHWQDHFQMSLETGVIEGLTPVGRASAARLQMNHPLQVAARIRWIKLGLLESTVGEL